MFRIARQANFFLKSELKLSNLSTIVWSAMSITRSFNYSRARLSTWSDVSDISVNVVNESIPCFFLWLTSKRACFPIVPCHLPCCQSLGHAWNNFWRIFVTFHRAYYNNICFSYRWVWSKHISSNDSLWISDRAHKVFRSATCIHRHDLWSYFFWIGWNMDITCDISCNF